MMSEIPCTAKPVTACEDCILGGKLMCRYEKRDILHFFMIWLPFFGASIVGVIRAGYGWWLLGWLAYMLFFFFLWEARVLCSHCPYWAGEGLMLRCPANYGVIKLWKYRPGPMSRAEQIQFLIGALLLLLIPIILMVAGKDYLTALIGLASAISFSYLLRRNICTRCINFSCPLNDVDSETQKAFFARNPSIAEAWKADLNGSSTDSAGS